MCDRITGSVKSRRSPSADSTAVIITGSSSSSFSSSPFPGDCVMRERVLVKSDGR